MNILLQRWSARARLGMREGPREQVPRRPAAILAVAFSVFVTEGPALRKMREGRGTRKTNDNDGRYEIVP